jgi:hypothetical protein
MAGAAKTKAEKQYAEIQKKDKVIIQNMQSASQIRLEKSARLRELRVAKEVQDAAEKLEREEKAKGEVSTKKPRIRTSGNAPKTS